MFLRNERFSEYIRFYPIVSWLIAINLFIYVWTGFFPFLGGQEIQLLGIGNNIAVLVYDEWWRLLTPIFLHATIMHVAFNSFALFLFGPALETLLGRFQFLLFYLGTGVFANVVYLFLGDPRISHLGASGAVYGLLGMYLYMAAVRKDLISRVNAQTITIIIIIGVIMTFINPGINIIAHLFGMIAGAAVSPLLLRRKTPSDTYRSASRPAEDEIGFDPDRWRKKEKWKKRRWMYLLSGAALMIGFFAVVNWIFFM
ncbi:rhomboid family intramembrane serine protease [Alkalicoccus urumqiensis]|uniref:Rhomboid family intramembrane serine protease n=1 Tax=Alkalicoccus urumqiensis TaxID=1548213 RepID=A0A2P6MHZ2_ALKUR|nr:rhomboid family intramembrane serine protease [Alkalicoccus urumqiensis]PRO65902.1 rhomboid family intramembrane serine protease [Alkalicoccus urumqiensis]